MLVKAMIVYKSKVFKVREQRVTLPNGKRPIYTLVDHPGAIMLLPIMQDKIMLIREYRPAVKQWLYQLPAGTIEKNELPKQTASRELIEETGYSSNKITFLFKSYTTPGTSNEIMHFFIAEDLRKAMQNLDENETIEVKPTKITKILEMIKSGKIMDDNTISGIMYYVHIHKQNKL